MQYLYTVLLLVFAVCFHCSANTLFKQENVIVNASSIPNTSVTQIDGTIGESTTVHPLVTVFPGKVSPTFSSTTNVIPTINSTAVPASSTSTSKPLPSSKGTSSTTESTSAAPTTTKPTLAPNSSIVTTTAPHHERKFDGPSFVGGIILALSMVAIGFVALKFYKTRTELNYHTL